MHTLPLTSIRSGDELEAAQKIMDQILTKGKLSSEEAMYLRCVERSRWIL